MALRLVVETIILRSSSYNFWFLLALLANDIMAYGRRVLVSAGSIENMTTGKVQIDKDGSITSKKNPKNHYNRELFYLLIFLSPSVTITPVCCPDVPSVV